MHKHILNIFHAHAYERSHGKSNNQLYTQLRCRHSCFADYLIFGIYLISMNHVYVNGKIYLIPDGESKMKLNTLYPRSSLSHTVSEPCEMRDENIVWN